MRVGHCMSQLLDPSKPLFEEDRPWELLPEEQWEQAQEPRRPAPAAGAGRRGPAAAAGRAAGAAAAGGGRAGGGGGAGGQREAPAGIDGDEGEWPLTETDSDDEAELGSEGEELAPYDLEESDDEGGWAPP